MQRDDSELENPPSVLSPGETRRLYDRIGARQDRHALYEDPAVERLLEMGRFDSAEAVFELGCGTGRFARRLLAEHLRPTATYHGVDLSPTMVELAQQRLEPFSARARVESTDDRPTLQAAGEAYDRFVSNFVFDLLSEEAIRSSLEEAHRLLADGGLLCLTGLSPGTGLLSRSIAALIRRLHAWRPELVGGCRPVDLPPLLAGTAWEILASDRIVAWTIPMQVVVACRRGPRRQPAT